MVLLNPQDPCKMDGRPTGGMVPKNLNFTFHMTIHHGKWNILLILLHRVHYLGKEGEEGAALLQLPVDEKAERRQADDGCMASASHRKMGEIAGQASYAEAARPPFWYKLI